MEDREETLVNVAFSCKVMKPLILSPQTPDKAADVMKKRISSGELVTSENRPHGPLPFACDYFFLNFCLFAGVTHPYMRHVENDFSCN